MNFARGPKIPVGSLRKLHIFREEKLNRTYLLNVVLVVSLTDETSRNWKQNVMQTTDIQNFYCVLVLQCS